MPCKIMFFPDCRPDCFAWATRITSSLSIMLTGLHAKARAPSWVAANQLPSWNRPTNQAARDLGAQAVKMSRKAALTVCSPPCYPTALRWLPAAPPPAWPCAAAPPPARGNGARQLGISNMKCRQAPPRPSWPQRQQPTPRPNRPNACRRPISSGLVQPSCHPAPRMRSPPRDSHSQRWAPPPGPSPARCQR